MKKVLVTGARGFIGSHLTKRLCELGYDVTAVDNRVGEVPREYRACFELEEANVQKRIEVERIDSCFSDRNILYRVSSGYYDVIFHQAALPRVSYSVSNPVLTTEENLQKSVKLFSAVAESPKQTRVVWASSSSVYGGNPNLPLSEEMRGKFLPVSPYAWQKYSLEDFSLLCRQLWNMDIIGLRYFNVFGPGQVGSSPYSTAISAWLDAIFSNRPLRKDGDGTQTRDMCYIDNVVLANIITGFSPQKFDRDTTYPTALNVGTGTRVSNNEILEKLEQRYGKLDIVQAPTRQGDVKDTLANIEKIKSLGYCTQVGFWEGFDRTAKWYENVTKR